MGAMRSEASSYRRCARTERLCSWRARAFWRSLAGFLLSLLAMARWRLSLMVFGFLFDDIGKAGERADQVELSFGGLVSDILGMAMSFVSAKETTGGILEDSSCQLVGLEIFLLGF